ncbi:MAG: TlyA family RNA methyltransferase [Kiritimatiellae bacterium]|nr:TlyA family RNA methyltransferase [Kiritimatiellia bacterium]
MSRIRLDQLMVEKGLVESRSRAQRLIMAGLVEVDGGRAAKAGHLVADDATVELREKERFVSRGGEKLQAVFDRFGMEVEDRICMDVGASTGGFTDCLLQHGARKVYAIDVGKGQLHWKLRNDSRVVVMEEVNARYLAASDLPERPTVAVSDVSFISLTIILPPVTLILPSGGCLAALIKPQFEAGREQVGRGGVVRDEQVRAEVVERICRFCVERLGLENRGVGESPLRGPAGNVEYITYWVKP